MKFCFGDIVVIDGNLIGVVVKCWTNRTYDVYVRVTNAIISYKETDMERYMVRHKYLDEEELQYQRNAIERGEQNDG